MTGETVVIELTPEGRMRLDRQVGDRMERLGFRRCDYAALDLGFHLPLNWPADTGCEVTLGQLVVLGHKLKMRIIIDNLNLEGRDDG